MYYPDEVIEEVRQKNNIVDVVSSYVRLQKKGANYFGLCPFHNEKSPSFSVSPIKQMYYCFGCGAGGNVISFVMEYENENFVEALQELAQRAGVTLPEHEATEEEKRQVSLKQKLLEVQKEAAKFYCYALLKSTEGQNALQYLTDRGLSVETIRSFGLGYSPQQSDALYRYLKNKGYSDELLKQCGIFVYKEKRIYDRFWNRVMFPIMDRNNRVIGFGGRVMGQGEPKYLNSPETLIFDKGRNLFGLHEAKHSRKDYMLVCEGYMDVISLHQAGFTNAVASLGTAFTQSHALVLKRYTDNVVLTYDSDGAGHKAALRAIPILRDAGMHVKVLDMKPYKDPDEFIKNLGGEEYEKRIENAINAFFFETGEYYSKFDLGNPDQKTEFMNGLAAMLCMFEDEIERENYLDAVAERYNVAKDPLRKKIFSLTSNNSSTNLKKEIKKLTGINEIEPEEKEENEKKKTNSITLSRDPKREGVIQAQRMLLAWIAEEPTIYPLIRPYLHPEDFTDELAREMAQGLFEILDKEPDCSEAPSRLLNRYVENEQKYSEASNLFFSKTKDNMEEDQREQMLNDAVKKILMDSNKQKMASVTSMEELKKMMEEQQKIAKIQIHLP